MTHTSSPHPDATPEALFAFFDQLGLSYHATAHEAAFTVDQGNDVWSDIPGMHCKNLFLKDSKANLWLIVAPAEKRIDLKKLPAKIGSARLSFGSAELLQQVLGVTPGSVTPLALINDPEHRVSLVLDAEMMAAPVLNYHPMVNTQTVTLSNADFRTFVKACGHNPVIVDVG